MKKTEEMLTHAYELFEKGQLIEAGKIYEECLEKLEKTSELYAKALNVLAFIKSSQGEYKQARQMYSELRQLLLAKGNLKDEHFLVHQLGMVERLAKNYYTALELFETELSLLKSEKPTFLAGFAANYYERGFISLQLGQLDQAKKLLLESLEYAKESGDLISLGCSLRGLGEVYLAKNERSKANTYFVEAINTFKEGQDEIAVQEVNSLLENNGLN